MTPLLLAALTATAPVPEAQLAPTCFTAVAEIAEYLDAWGETQAFSGQTDDGAGSLLLFTSATSWSLVGSFNGLVCIVEQGRDWQSLRIGGPL